MPHAMSTDAPGASILVDRFPRLAAIPRLDVVRPETPLERAENLSRFSGRDLWVKRDDLTNDVYGGNKIRKLAYLLGEARAQGRDTLLTAGALGSHHALATAIHGKRAGFEVHAFLSPQPWTEHVEENLRAHVTLGTRLHPVRSALLAPPAMQLEALALRRRGRRPYVIPHGGTGVVGALGYVEAGLELAAQLDDKRMPEPDVVYVSLGSGGTAAGLALGLAAGGVALPVRAVLVTTRLVGNRAYLHRLMRQTLDHLRAIEPRFPEVLDIATEMLSIDDAWLAVGYGVENDELRRVAELAATDGIHTDPTYTAPALATMMEDAETRGFRRALFIHTLSSADLGPFLTPGVAAPDWARRMAARAS